MFKKINRSIFSRRRDMDMTEGSIPRLLLSFAFPIMLGSLFQQFYNMVDTWVVGNYVSNEAFAAVGTVTPIINLLIGFFTGLSTGAGVVISQYFGAHRYDKVHDAVHSYVALSLILCVVFTGVGLALTPFLLNLMGTASEVLPQSTAYLSIYFKGVSGLLIYNMGAAILRAAGDSRRPFHFLMVSALLNIVLDLILVLVFHMGVEGVAYATIISQGVSAVLTLVSLARSHSAVQLSFSSLSIHRDILSKILKMGFPAALQAAIPSFSNIFLQSYIYQFGPNYMSGWAAYSKLFHLFLIPEQSIGMAVSTFVGQNLGNNNPERAKKGVGIGLRISMAIMAPLVISCWLIAPQIVAFFNSTPEVIELGTLFIRVQIPMLIFVSVDGTLCPAIRGSGNSKVPTVITLSTYVVFRQVYLYVMSNFISNTIVPIILVYPLGWLLAIISSAVYYKKVGLEKNRLIEDAPAS